MLKVISIVVTYNGEQWVNKCFSSLVQSKIENHRILAIDNGSTDSTLDMIRKDFPAVEIIETGENLGFGKANNIGLEIAKKEEADYAFLLNQDAWIEDDVLERLIEANKRHNDYGILSPLHLYSQDRLDQYFSDYTLKCNTAFAEEYEQGQFSKELYEVEFVNAALWLMSRECIEKVGLFAPIFFHYGEDSNYVKRAQYHGVKTGVVPLARGYHLRSQNMVHSTKLPFKKFVIVYQSKLLDRMLDINHSIFIQWFSYLFLFLRAIVISAKGLRLRRIGVVLGFFLKFGRLSDYVLNRRQMKLPGAYLKN